MATFRLHSGDLDFNSRVDTLFSSLQTAAKELEPQLKRKHEDEAEEEEEELGAEDGRAGQSFRRPQGRPPQWRGQGGGRGWRGRGRGGSGPRNSTPDYIKNPGKWTRYRMDDTRVLSDSENRREGLRLLADLEARPDRTKPDTQDMDCSDDTPGTPPKIVFKKPSVPHVTEAVYSKPLEEYEQAEEPLSSEFGGPKKFVMQEYVVGKTKPKSKGKVTSEKVASDKETVKSEVKLSYLMFEEED